MERNQDALRKFGACLTLLRLHKNMSIPELSQASGLEPVLIERIEAGKVDFHLTTMLALARGLDMDPGELLKTL